MWSLIARFLPSLTGGLSAFLNPWVLLSITTAFGSGVMWEMFRGSARLDAYEAKVEAAQAIQAAKVAIRTADDKRAKENADAEAKLKLADLRNYIDGGPERERLLIAKLKAGSGSVPRIPSGTGSRGATICFPGPEFAKGVGDADGLLRSGLAESVGRLQSGAVGILQRGQGESIVAGICSRWAVGRATP